MTSYPMLCPGPANIQCCVDYWGTCSANGQTGKCQSTSTCGGKSTAGLCPGPSGVQCCTTSSSPPSSGSGYSAPKANNMGVPFAPMTGKYWPIGGQSTLATRAPICYLDSNSNYIQNPTSPVAANFDCSVRRFLALRDGGSRYHSGVDLYADTGTPVVATEAGRVVNTYLFYENVCCVIVQTDSGSVINYGEISCNYVVKTGQRVSAGQRIGTVGQLTCCHAMLHFETYVQGVTANLISVPGNVASQLRNPTEYLLNLQEKGMTA